VSIEYKILLFEQGGNRRVRFSERYSLFFINRLFTAIVDKGAVAIVW